MKDKIILVSDRIAEYALYLLIFVLPFANAGIEIFFTIAFLAWLTKRISAHGLKNLFPTTPLNKALLAFVLANFIAVIMSTNFKESIKPFFTKLLENLLLFFIITDTINTKRRLKNLFGYLIFSILLVSADATVQYFRGVDFLRAYPITDRLRACFRSPNEFASWLSMMIFIVLGIFMLGPKRKYFLGRIELGILLLFLIFLLELSYSRGAWLGSSIGLVIFIGYNIIRLPKNRKTAVLLFIPIFVATIFYLMPFTVKSRIYSIGIIEGNGPILFRYELWKEALSIIKDFPLFGAGFNTYMKTSANYSSISGGQGMSYTHNSYLQMAAETGLIGLICFFWVLFRFFMLSLRALLNNESEFSKLFLCFLVGILGFLIHAFFDTHLYSLKLMVLFWYMLGLTIAVIKLETK